MGTGSRDIRNGLVLGVHVHLQPPLRVFSLSWRHPKANPKSPVHVLVHFPSHSIPCPRIPNTHGQHLPWALEVSKHLQSKCLLYLPWKKNMLHAFINYSFCRSESGLDLVGFLSLKVLDRVLVTSRINWWENHSQVPLCGSTLFSQSLFAIRL